MEIPVFSIGVWGKATLHLRSNLMGYERVRGPKKLLITEPDTHRGAQTLFADTGFHQRELLPWCDHHLKGAANAVMDDPTCASSSIAAAPSGPPTPGRRKTQRRCRCI